MAGHGVADDLEEAFGVGRRNRDPAVTEPCWQILFHYGEEGVGMKPVNKNPGLFLFVEAL